MNRKHALRKTSEIQQNQGEKTRTAYRLEKCKGAFLGTANVDVMDGGPQLIFRTYNPGRTTNRDTVSAMAAMIEVGRCDSRSNPLVVAIDVKAIKTESLTRSYDATNHTPSLHDAEFTYTNPRLEVLAGAHRVFAARQAKTKLESDIAKFRTRLKEDEVSDDSGDDDYNPDAEAEADKTPEVGTTAEILKGAIQAKQVAIEGASVWPIHFYDFG